MTAIANAKGKGNCNGQGKGKGVGTLASLHQHHIWRCTFAIGFSRKTTGLVEWLSPPSAQPRCDW